MTEAKKSKPSFLARLLPKRFRKDKPLVPVVRLTGAIGMPSPLRSGISLSGCASALEKAFGARGAAAVAISINSPGGSPVQSHLIFKRIRALAEEKSVPCYTFCEDAAASGGYMLACAGDEIYADPSSIVGSIGVVSSGFGFDQAIEKLGVERRVYTAGERKVILDPFQPEKAADVKQLLAIQKHIHDTFKTLVRERRGEILNGNDKKLFSGEFWAGEQAKELGLIDDLGDLRSVMRAKFGEKVRLKVMNAERSWLSRRLGFDALKPALPMFGGGFNLTEDALSALEARALWARIGL